MTVNLDTLLRTRRQSNGSHEATVRDVLALGDGSEGTSNAILFITPTQHNLNGTGLVSGGLLSAYSSPIPLVEPLGENKVILPVGAILLAYLHRTKEYTDNNGSAIFYGAPDNGISPFSFDGDVFNQGDSNVSIMPAQTIRPGRQPLIRLTGIANVGLYFANYHTNMTDGDGDALIRMDYRVIDLSPYL